MVRYLRNKSKGTFAGSIGDGKLKTPTPNLLIPKPKQVRFRPSTKLPRKPSIFRPKQFGGTPHQVEEQILENLVAYEPWVGPLYDEDDFHFELFINVYGWQMKTKEDNANIILYRKARDSKNISQVVETFTSVEQLVLFRNPATILGFLMNKRLTSADLDKLQVSMLRVNARWESFLAAHPKTSEKTLSVLASKASNRSMNILAQRADLTDEVALKLAENGSKRTRERLCYNKFVSEEVRTLASLIS